MRTPLRDVLLTLFYDAFQVAAFHGKLNADVARIILAIDEGSAGGFADGGEFGERNLLPRGCGNQQIADVPGIRTELWFHSNHHVEKFFALNDLGGGLPADSGLDDGFDVGDVDGVACDFLAVGIDDETGLAEFADDG